MYINGLIRYNLISLVTDGINAYTEALNDLNSGFMSNKEVHLKNLDNLIILLEYLQEEEQ
jgi:hypothetical protein